MQQYVYLERIPDSKKRKTIKLTDTGEAFVHDKFLLMHKTAEKALSRMTRKERESYVTLYEKYVFYLQKETNFIYSQKIKNETVIHS